MADEPQVPDVSQPAGAPPETPATPSFREFVGQYGIDGTAFQSDEELGRTLGNVITQYQGDQQWADLGRQVASKWQEFQAWQQSQAQPEPEPEPQKPAFDWKVPDYSPEWEQLCERDQTGLWAPKVPAVAEYAQKLNQYEQWFRSNGRKVITEFPNLVEQRIEPILAEREKSIEERVAKMVEERFQNYMLAQQQQAFIQQNLSHLFQLDQNNNILTDGRGQGIYTPKGQALVEYLSIANAPREQGGLGLGPPQNLTYALQMVRADEALGRFGQPQQQQAAPQAPGPKPGDETPFKTPAQVANGNGRRKRFVDRAVPNSPNRDGTVPDSNAPPSASQNPRASMKEIMEQEMAKAGLTSTL